MDDAKRFALLILNALTLGLVRVGLCVTVLAAAPGARAAVDADADYVSPAQITTLAGLFNQARLDDPSLLARHPWTCEMYGVRYKIQVLRGQNLYRFTGDGAARSFVNTGDEPIGSYRVTADGLEGHGDKGVVDQVRLTKDGRLISKLTLPARGITVAYAVCTGS